MDQTKDRPNCAYHIFELKSEKDLLNIKADYIKLFNGKNGYSHFQSFEWLQLFLKYVLSDKENLCIYLLYRNKNLIAIAPLIKKRKCFYWEYQFCYEKTQADYLDFIYNDLEPYELEILLKKILNRHFLCNFLMKKVPDSSKTLLLMGQNKKIRFLQISKEKCVQIRMYESFNEYSERFGKSTKKEIKSVENKIKNNFGAVEVDILYEKALDKQMLDELNNIYLKRRIVKFGKEKREENYFEFIKAYILQNKDVFVSLLRLNQKIVAFNIGFLSRNNKLEILITSFDSEYGKYKVGNYLLYNSIRKIIESELVRKRGVIYYDLGLGDELYKIKYGGEYHYINELYLSDNSFLFGNKVLEMKLIKIGKTLFKPLFHIIKREMKRIGNIKVITNLRKKEKDLKLNEGEST